MAKPASYSLLWLTLLVTGITVRPALSQSSPEPEKTGNASEAKAEHSETKAESAEEKSGHKDSPLPEVEFVASSLFRSGSLIQPLTKHLNLEGHYFGGGVSNVGIVGGSYKFHGKHWHIEPGIGVAFADNNFRTMPALTVRWAYERGWFVTEGLAVQGLLHTTFPSEGEEGEVPDEPAPIKSVTPFIADGNHISARWRRLTAGGTWEHVQFREGVEWKGGVRIAYKMLPHTSLTMFIMGPNTEVRGGILFLPEKEQ
jgi:hypothetical protein